MRVTNLVVAVLCFAAAATAAAQEERTGGPYVPTPQSVVDEMLRLADVREEDFVVDLGSGDGRIPIAAAKRFGARALGVEYDHELVQRTRPGITILLI